MQFAIVTDTSANLPAAFLRENEIAEIPFSYYIDGVEYLAPNSEEFDGAAFYSMMRHTEVTTSLVNVQRYLDYFTPILERGEDILYIGMSSGISGAMQAGMTAMDLLREEYPERKMEAFDTLAASLGEGLFVIEAARLRQEGYSMEEVLSVLEQKRPRVCQYFTVDDLRYLKRGGRISGATAVVGTVLSIKPILKGNEEGKIIAHSKVRGRKNSIQTLANHLANEIHGENQTIYIAHGDCPEEAELLADLIREHYPSGTFLIVCYEPVTGSHVGPGTLALFFEGTKR